MRRRAARLKLLVEATARRLPRYRAEAVDRFVDSPGAVSEPVALEWRNAPATSPSVSPAVYADVFALTVPEKFADWRPQVATIPNARIVSPGMGVVDGAGKLVKESLWDEEHYRRNFRRRLPRPDRHFPGTATSLLTLWADNYYHWLIDALPRLGVLQAAGRDFRQLPIIVPGTLTRFQEQSLDALRIPPALRIPLDGSSLGAENLVWASAPAPIGFCSPFVSKWLKAELVPASTRRTRRLFLARRVRKVANEREVVALLGEHGFEVIRPEELSFLEQVELFASAEMVVGPHGAGMANVVFGQDLRVLELFQPGYLNTGPYSVARASGHRYWAMMGDPVYRPGPAKDTDIHVDPRRLAAIVEEMIESPSWSEPQRGWVG